MAGTGHEDDGSPPKGQPVDEERALGSGVFIEYESTGAWIYRRIIGADGRVVSSDRFRRTRGDPSPGMRWGARGKLGAEAEQLRNSQQKGSTS